MSQQHATNPRVAPTSQYHSYPIGYAMPDNIHAIMDNPHHMPHGAVGTGPVLSPTKAAPKPVTFVLLLPETPQFRARLPMRVNINAHDTTNSITTTVKNFYGLYDSGVSFGDSNGNTLSTSYDNFEHDMTVYVRVVMEQGHGYNMYSMATSQGAVALRKPHLDEPCQMLPPSQHSRPTSRTVWKRSASPHQNRDRRSASVSTQGKQRPRPDLKSWGSSTHGSVADVNSDAANGYSSSNSGEVSGSSFRKTENDLVASAEISVENIVKGGRRKRAKFESSELPLFVPPQVPMTASKSSIWLQRRINSGSGASPFAFNKKNTIAYPQLLPPPRSYSNGEGQYMQNHNGGGMGQAHGHRMRGRGAYAPKAPTAAKAGMPPTLDLTISSVISDEDVALQLMRLGDVSNFSSHGHTSTSTADDALSGKAEAASSNTDDDDKHEEDDNLPPRHGQGASGDVRGNQRPGSPDPPSLNSMETSGDEYEDHEDGTFGIDSDEIMPNGYTHASGHRKSKSTKAKARGSVSSVRSSIKSTKSKTEAKPSTGDRMSMSPSSMPLPSRKASNASLTFQHLLGADVEDLSSKPRCQRCRKSKKGCDRQRPCQRCREAGMGTEGCISEDEGNGRKGRYGRHMGMSVKKETEAGAAKTGAVDNLMPAPRYIPSLSGSADKSKKRKR